VAWPAATGSRMGDRTRIRSSKNLATLTRVCKQRTVITVTTPYRTNLTDYYTIDTHLYSLEKFFRV